MQTQINNIFGLDVGNKRVGIAMANTLARLSSPRITLVRDEKFWSKLDNLISEEMVSVLVVGLPRNLDGEDTAQTLATRDFVAELKEHFSGEIVMQDEALTSIKAEQELNSRKTQFSKADIDSLAATYILDDYLNEMARG